MVGVTFLSIVVGPAGEELLLEVVENGLLLEILFRMEPLCSSFRDCCFSVIKGGNDSALMISLTWLVNEELLISCCSLLLDLGQMSFPLLFGNTLSCPLR